MGLISTGADRIGTELDFVKLFCSQFSSFDERVTRLNSDSDIEAQFSDTSNTPSFSFNVDGKFNIVFTRSAALSSSSSSYVVYLDIDGSLHEINTIYISSSDLAYTAKSERVLSVEGAVSDNGIVLAIYPNYMASNQSIACVSYLSSDEASAVWTSDYKGFNTSNSYGYRLDSAGRGNSVTSLARMTYRAKIGTLEAAGNKYIYDSGRDESIKLTNIFDCSTVVAFVPINVNMSTYFSVDEHTLVKI